MQTTPTVSKYTIIKELRSGSFGIIYEVLVEHHQEDGKAISTTKCVLKELSKFDTLSKERFEREIKILSELNHPNIVPILYWDVGGDAPRFLPYFVMEFLQGGSLKEYMDEKFNNDVNFVFEPTWTINMIILPICNALALTHSKQVYHRDLKPDNIMFIDKTKSGIKIADWGLVKGDAIDRSSLELTAVTSDGQIGGTPGYCSPEQWFAYNTDDIDGRTDIYSLGVMFYDMLTRRRPIPYNTDDPHTLETKQQHQLQPSQPSVSNQKSVDFPSKYNTKVTTELDNCILKMINIDPAKRYSSIWDLITDLDMMK
jgi:serine/threonine protein kinase